MTSLDNIYKKMAPEPEPGSLPQLPPSPPPLEPARQVGREVAHELNNILTIIQGYSDKLVLCHGEDPALRADLQLISENARRAVAVIRKASPRRAVSVLIG